MSMSLKLENDGIYNRFIILATNRTPNSIGLNKSLNFKTANKIMTRIVKLLAHIRRVALSALNGL